MSCKHCSVSSGPDENSRLNIGGIIEQIAAAKQRFGCRGIHISGGEPFLYVRDVQRLAKGGAELGLAVAVATNASWATTEEKARALLLKIPGLTQLLLSTDIYHSEYAPPIRVTFAARAGSQLGLHVTVNVCQPHGSCEALDECLTKLIEANYENVEVVTSDLELGGRANDLEEAHWRGRSSVFPQGACRQLKRPVILEDKRILACCNTTVVKNVAGSPLLDGCGGGDLNLINSLSTFQDNKILKAVQLFGPAFLASRLAPETQKKLVGDYVRGDICGLCQDLMSRADIVEEMQTVVETQDVTTALSGASDLMALGFLD